MTAPSVTELIEIKRDGGRLSDDAIRQLIASYTDGSIPDYQMAALTMAIFIRGLDTEELTTWTDAMLHSGDVLDLSAIDGPKIDKHSTGGVGDKISISLAPIVTACGVNIPMMSGRGLGHTGGTLDKLESIPGFTTAFDRDQFRDILARTGLVLAGQSERLVPADRKLYALRDATGTVPSIPLIASSIMSKKLAEDLDGLVLDVKTGSGAFMEEPYLARRLAQTMIDIGSGHGIAVTALITAMEQPLGRAVGNAHEIRESIAVLSGGGPSDVIDLTKALAVEMLNLADIEDGEHRVEQAIASGAALEKFGEVIAAQGGDPRVIEDPALLPHPAHEIELTAEEVGVVTQCDAHTIGVAAMRLGAGRARKEDDIDPSVGITLEAKMGDTVKAGDPLAVVGVSDPAHFDHVEPLLRSAWELGENPLAPTPLILDRLSSKL